MSKNELCEYYFIRFTLVLLADGRLGNDVLVAVRKAHGTVAHVQLHASATTQRLDVAQRQARNPTFVENQLGTFGRRAQTADTAQRNRRTQRAARVQTFGTGRH